MVDKEKPGVVFSSGFFGFFAHAGFLSAIRDSGYLPAGFAGSSSGAILGAMAAAGMDDLEIKEMLFPVTKSDFWDPDPVPFLLKNALKMFKGYSGYLNGNGFRRLLEKLPFKNIEESPYPLVISATNITDFKEEAFTSGCLIDAIHASGAVPMLFKPVKINGSFYVDGGIVNKAPVLPLARHIKVKKIIVHFISSGNIGEKIDRYLNKKLTPWHIYSTSVNVARMESYKRQCELLEKEGVEIIEIRTNAPPVNPNHLDRGPSAYEKARQDTIALLER